MRRNFVVVSFSSLVEERFLHIRLRVLDRQESVSIRSEHDDGYTRYLVDVFVVDPT